jgi:hypothetical protein
MTALLGWTALCGACGDISNEPPRAGQIHDLSTFGLSAADRGPDTAYRLVQRGAIEPGPTGSFTFMRGGERWVGLNALTGEGYARQLTLERLDHQGAVVESHVYSALALYGDAVTDTISGLADDQGTIWLLSSSATSADLGSLDLAAGRLVRHLPAPPMPQAIAQADGVMYVAGDKTLAAIDLTSGATTDLGEVVRGQLPGDTYLSAIAASGGKLLVNTRFSPTDGAFIIDLATKTIDSFVGGLPIPVGAIAARLQGDASGFTAVDENGALVHITLGDMPVPEARSITTRAFSRPDARALALKDDELWVLFTPVNATASLILYDPKTLQPVDGFALPASIARVVDSYGLETGPVAMTADKTSLYIATTPQIGLGMGGSSSRIDVIDIATGVVRATYNVPDPVAALCSDGVSLWAAYSLGLTDRGYARVDSLVPSTGLVQRSLAPSAIISGLPKLLCSKGVVAVSGSLSRLWTAIPTKGSGDPFNFSLAEPTSGSSAAVDKSGLWLLDRTRNLLVQAGPVDGLSAL